MLAGRSWPKLKRTTLASQAPANNLRRFSALHSTDLKNRTGIGSHPTAGKNQQIQAPLTGYVRSSEFRSIWNGCLPAIWVGTLTDWSWPISACRRQLRSDIAVSSNLCVTKLLSSSSQAPIRQPQGAQLSAAAADGPRQGQQIWVAYTVATKHAGSRGFACARADISAVLLRFSSQSRAINCTAGSRSGPLSVRFVLTFEAPASVPRC